MEVATAARARRWPFTGRGDLVARLTDSADDDDVGGTVVIGPAGAGKTRLVEEVLSALDDERRVLRAVGHGAAADIPLGALAHLLPPSLFDGLGVGTDDRTALFHAAHRVLADNASEGRTVLAVDDIDLLDDTSLALLVPSIVARDVYVIGTVRSGRTPSARLSRLQRDGHLQRLDLEPLGDDDIERLVRHALGGPVDSRAITRLTELSGGNLQILTELVRGGREHGWLTIAAGRWVVAGRPTPTVVLDELIAEHLAEVDEEGRDLLEHLALCERFGLEDLEREFGAEVLAYLEREGLVELVQSGRRAAVRLAHPLFGEVLEAQLPPLRRRTLLRRLADLVEAHGARRRDDELRIVSWRLGSGGGAALSRRIRAAKAALLGHDLTLALELLDGSPTEGETDELLAERLHVLGEATVQLGRVEEAIEHLRAADPLTLSDPLRVQIALRLADAQFFAARDVDAALESCARARDQVDSEPARAAIDAQRAVILANAGLPVLALDALDAIEGELAPGTQVDVLVARAASLIAVGRCGEGAELARQAADRQRQLPEWLARRGSARHVINEAHALGYAGHNDAARRVLEPAVARARASGAMGALVWFEMTYGELTRDIGLPEESLAHCTAAIELAASSGQESALVWAYVGVAQAHLLAGRCDAAERAIELAASAGESPVATSAATLRRAEAWLLACRGDLAGARAELLDIAESVRRDGVYIFEAALLHDVVRFGDAPTVVERLSELGTTLAGPVHQGFREHAAASAAGDAAALVDCVDRFEAIGSLAFAAETAAEAAELFVRSGDQRGAAALRQRAAAISERAGGLDTPPLRRAESVDPLTEREREIALLASAGATSKAIAEHLVVSTRTVDTHLARVYRKLGVRGRHELGDALAGGQAGDGAPT